MHRSKQALSNLLADPCVRVGMSRGILPWDDVFDVVMGSRQTASSCKLRQTYLGAWLDKRMSSAFIPPFKLKVGRERGRGGGGGRGKRGRR